MINFENLKREITIDEMAEAINSEVFGLPCSKCAYNRDICSGEDCLYGIKRWLQRECGTGKIAGKKEKYD